MDFRREDYRKYGTCSIIIKNVLFSLKGCEVFNIEETKYGYKKATVKLSPEMIGKMKKVEKDVNEVLDESGFDKVTIVYGNRVYAKMKSFTTRPNTLKLQSVYINNHNKSFVQMWLWSN